MKGCGSYIAKGDNKRVRSTIQDQRKLQLGQQSQLGNQYQDLYTNANNQDQALRNQITQGYTNFNVDDMLAKYGYGSGGSVSGGIDPTHISNFGADPYAGYKNASQGGLLTPDFWNSFNKSMANPETGGYSAEQINSMGQQSMAPSQAVYAGAQRDLARSQSLGGINSGNNAAAISRLARDQSQAMNTASTNNQANLAGLEQQGKQFQVQARTQVQELDAQLKLAGLGGMTDIEKTRLEAELQNAQLNQSASASNSGNANARAQFAAQMEMAKLGGMQNLYSSAPGATGQAIDAQLNLQNLSQSGNLGLIGQQISGSQIPGDFQQGLGNIGGVMNLASSVLGPLSGIFGGAKKGNKSGAPSPYGVSNMGNFPSNNIFK